jgi:hypothetical protein
MNPRRKLSADPLREELKMHRKYRALLISECGTDDIAVLSSLNAQVAALSAKLTDVEMMIMPYKGGCSPEGHKALCSLVPKLIIEKVALARELKRVKAIGYLERMSKRKKHRNT